MLQGDLYLTFYLFKPCILKGNHVLIKMKENMKKIFEKKDCGGG